MRLNLSFLLFLLPTLGFHSQGSADTWWCQVQTSLVGKTQHYFVHGRDAWESQALMECKSQNISIEREIQVVFSSQKPGFGADDDSQVDFNLTLWMDSNPWDLKTRMDLTGNAQGSFVYYSFRNSQATITARAWTGANPAVAKSLSQGALIIRPIFVNTAHSQKNATE